MNVFQLAKEIEEEVIHIRRELHEHPEVSMQEFRTIKVVTKNLENIGVDYEIIPYGGVIGTIEGKQPGKTIILRADLDALPMKEEAMNLNQKKVVVSKTDKAAHTCGHDGHTAMLLGAAKILASHRSEIKGKIILAFEQGEEIGGGIYRLLKRLVEIGADGVWGIHFKSDLAAGKISVEPGPRMSAVSIYNVKITGKSGHGSRPDLANSPIDCFHDIYHQLQSMRLRKLDPFQPITYSVGKLVSGTAVNIIPETLEFGGTIRYLHFEQGKAMIEEFKKIIETTCEKNGFTYEYVNKPKAIDLPVYNQEQCAAIAEKAIEKALGKDIATSHPMWMASEPFAFYQRYFPGVFAFLGVKNDEKGIGAEHHHPFFDLDEDVFKLGVAATVQYAIDFLNNDQEIRYEKETTDVENLFKQFNFPIYYPKDNN